MKPKKQYETPDLFRSRLEQILDQEHPIFLLANKIDWSVFDEEFGSTYVEDKGRPGNPTRLMVGLHYLKYTFSESDESVLARFLENPYWQYFCGFEYFQHTLPIDSSSLTRFRKRIGPTGFEALFKETVETAKRGKYLTKSHLNKVNVDVTVQEKAIAYPTDARLYHKMREALVRAAKAREITLRQSYRRLSKKLLMQQGRYSHARQYQRSRKATKRLKTMLGCVYRDILRKINDPDEELQALLSKADRLLKQKKDSKNKLYSVHAPEVECISKGKVHKRYEFGCKVGMATTSRDNWIVSISAIHGNPYDGHTLSASLEQVESFTGWSAKEAYVDLGYRGHTYQGDTQVHIVNFRHMKRMTRAVRHWFKRRAAIEPVFGHLKSDNRMSKNYLKGIEGDQINALLCGCGYNLRKLLAVFLCLVRKLLFLIKYRADIDFICQFRKHFSFSI
jgi:IS5 family transposase